MGLDECFEKQLIKKDETAKNRVKNSLLIANDFLDKAKGNMKMEYYSVSFSLSYNCLFHCCRALIFSKGYTEKSHGCMILFLKNEYKNNKKIYSFLKTIDSYRISRHSIQYEGEYVSEVDAKEALIDSEQFLKEIKKELRFLD